MCVLGAHSSIGYSIVRKQFYFPINRFAMPIKRPFGFFFRSTSRPASGSATSSVSSVYFGKGRPGSDRNDREVRRDEGESCGRGMGSDFDVGSREGGGRLEGELRR